MPNMYSETQNKLSKTRESPLESMGQIISSRCPIVVISLFETVKTRLFISQRNFYNSLESIEEKSICKRRRTAYSVVRSVGNFNSSLSKILCMSLLLASLKKNLVNSNQEKVETSFLKTLNDSLLCCR